MAKGACNASPPVTVVRRVGLASSVNPSSVRTPRYSQQTSAERGNTTPSLVTLTISFSAAWFALACISSASYWILGALAAVRGVKACLESYVDGLETANLCLESSVRLRTHAAYFWNETVAALSPKTTWISKQTSRRRNMETI